MIFFWNCSKGQNYNLVTTYSTEKGLTSNSVYDFVEDDNGFLWITTDNGVSRFDGKYFYNYTLKDGLPSNDVLQIVKQKDGTIWVNCFKQPPTYFDEKHNKFVTISNPQIENICKNLLNYFIPDEHSIVFYADNNFMEFKNRKFVKFWPSYFLKIEGKRSLLRCSFNKGSLNDKFEKKGNTIYFQNKYDHLGSRMVYSIYLTNNQMFTNESRTIQKFYDFGTRPLLQYKKLKIDVPEGIKWQRYVNDQLYLITNSGAMRIYSTKTFKLQKELFLDNTINCFFEDSNKNIWCGTLNEGVKCYLYSQIKKLEIPHNFIDTNFLSISASAKGKVFVGNLFGDVLKVEDNKFQKFNVKSTSALIRNIEMFGEKPLTISERGYSFDESSIQEINYGRMILSLKRATNLNDSIALISYIGGIIRLNIRTKSHKMLLFPHERVLSICKIDDDNLWIIAASGFYHYNLKKQQYRHLYEKFNFIAGVKDGDLLFVSTALGEIYIFKNEKLLKIIPNSTNLPENLIRMKVINHRLWIGSRNEVCIINYKAKKNTFLYTIKKITKEDGLISNSTNDICYTNSNVYLATDAGLSVIPENFKISKFDIQPQLIAIAIDQNKVAISDYYDLKENENNISLTLSGVELSGHFKHFQYSLNKGKSWNMIESNTLDLALIAGKTTLYVRSTDINNNISSKMLKLKFNVAIPFYQNSFFWIFIVIVVVALIFWVFNRRKFTRQRLEYEKQLLLEQQRNKITSDLHDDIGATLSSLQINSAVANKLLNKNPKEAHRVLQKIEIQSQNLADKIGDIIWSMKPGKDEFMTMSTRIKNFANEILGATEIQYSVNIDPILNDVVKDITTRKNIVLLIKEAINNAAKYSQATTLNISLSLHKDTIHIKISDNGIGFNANEIKGNGVNNMKRRAEELGGHFAINTQPKLGTTITATIPVIP